MIKIEKTEVVGWEHAIRGMRNPKNSWDKSDSYKTHVEDERTLETADYEFFVGDNDLKLMKTLANAGTDHRKYLRMINVYADITAPLYWWKEYDTYKVGTVANSCSTMHKIMDKEFALDDFSHEHLALEWGFFDKNNEDCEVWFLDGRHIMDGYQTLTDCIIPILNHYRNLYIKTIKKPMKEESKRAELLKKYWWQVIQLLPSSYNQKRTVMLNYEVLLNMYKSRKNHKLDEWREFCEWCESLPYFMEFVEV